MSIFISLNSQDIDDAEALQSTLYSWGFAGAWTMEGIPGGDLWKENMLEALKDASVCLLSVSKNGVTFTQGYEAGVAYGQGLRVIPVIHSGGSMEMLPTVLRGLQCRFIDAMTTDKCVLKSRLIHDIHPDYVAPTTRQWVFELAKLVVRALHTKRPPIVKNGIRATKCHTVAQATKKQQQAGMLHLTKHRDSAQFLESFRDQLDERYQDKINKYVDWLKDRGISEQVILRTCVLADKTALIAWKRVWKL